MFYFAVRCNFSFITVFILFSFRVFFSELLCNFSFLNVFELGIRGIVKGGPT